MLLKGAAMCPHGLLWNCMVLYRVYLGVHEGFVMEVGSRAFCFLSVHKRALTVVGCLETNTMSFKEIQFKLKYNKG